MDSPASAGVGLFIVTKLVQLLSGTGTTLVMVAIKCRIVRAHAARLNDETWRPSLKDMRNYFSAVCNHYLFALIVGLGSLLFIFPGFIVAAWGCLSLPAICLENCGPLKAFNMSSALTDSRRMEVARYVAIPVGFYALSSIPLLILGLLVRAGFPHSGPLIWTLFTLSFVVGVGLRLVDLTFIPLLVNLYRRFRTDTTNTAVAPVSDR
jgi:hypothetical protein